ncbi:hypothetical protein JCM8547_002826 [Rhodosporidiobolus lusitaniae]
MQPQGWLLVPLADSTLSTSDLLKQSSLWQPRYAILDSTTLRLLPSNPEDVRASVVWKASEINAVGRLPEYDKEDFEPFLLELSDGRRVVLAGRKKLDSAYWTLAIDNALRDNARSHSSRSSSSRSPSSSSQSSSLHSSLLATPPPAALETPSTTPERPSHSADAFQTHISKLEKLISDYDADLARFSSPYASPSKQKSGKRTPSWLPGVNRDVQAYAYVEELPRDAEEDDWGAYGEHLPAHAHAHGASLPPLRSSSSPWPARPPPEHPRPFSPTLPSHHAPPQPRDHRPDNDLLRLKPSHVAALQHLYHELVSHSEALNAHLAEGVEEKGIRDVEEELRRMRDEVLRDERDGKLEKADQALLNEIDWMLQLNSIRAQKQNNRSSFFDGRASGIVRPSSAVEGDVRRRIAARLEELLRSAEKTETREEKQDLGGVGREDQYFTTPLHTTERHFHHPDGAAFSPVPFVQPSEWGQTATPPPRSSAARTRATTPRAGTGGGGRAQVTPVPTSKFSLNTSEEVTPKKPRQAQRPTQDYGVPGEPLPYAPPHPPPLRHDLPDPHGLDLNPHAGNRHDHRDPPFDPDQADPYFPDDEERRYWAEVEEQERAAWERERWLQDVFLELEAQFRKQEKLISSPKDREKRLAKSVGKILHHVKHSSHRHNSQLSLLLRSVDDVRSALNALPGAVSSSLSLPPPPPPYRPSHLTPRAPARKEKLGEIPRSHLHLQPGNGRMGPKVLPAYLVPKGDSRPLQAAPVYGVDNPVPSSSHAPRWTHGAEGAKQAKELDALIAHYRAPPPSGAKGKKGKEAKVVEEMKQSEEVGRALREWEVREVVKGEKGRGGSDPAAKAFAIYEILHATREIAKRHQAEEAARKKQVKVNKGGLLVPASALPPASSPPRDDFSALLSRLLTSSEPPEKVLTSLAYVLDRKKLPASKAPEGWKSEEETRRALGELLKPWTAQKEVDKLKTKYNREVEDLKKQRAALQAGLAELLRER